jgi:UDP-2,3-diacylglucosamine hydrolase
MIDAVFISDLHLHPDEGAITARFDQFIEWAIKNTKSVYILGDFLHVWPGDDALDAWSKGIAKQLAKLKYHEIKLYFMHGNRDFLLGNHFAELAGMTILSEPSVITLQEEKVLLVHGDRYCTQDKAHQWLRRLTRNALFSLFFLKLPFKFRSGLVNKVRAHSQMNRMKPVESMGIVNDVMIKHMQQMQVTTLIHGHIHKPGLTHHCDNQKDYRQYVLSDWDDNPELLCYDKTNGFYFNRMPESLNG